MLGSLYFRPVSHIMTVAAWLAICIRKVIKNIYFNGMGDAGDVGMAFIAAKYTNICFSPVGLICSMTHSTDTSPARGVFHL
jgi:hypothetical protein